MLVEVLSADLFPQYFPSFILFNDFIYAFLVVEPFHLRVPLLLLRILNLHEFLILGAQLAVSRCKLDGLLEVLLRSVKVVFGFVRLRHAVVDLRVIRNVLKSAAT